MYSTDIRDQLFSEALPLKPLVCWAGSAQSVTLAVPPAPALASLQISTVTVSLTLPDGSVASAEAVALAGTPLWTASFPASAFATAGKVAEGFAVVLGGKDERGTSRVWIVAKGDLEVKSGDATPTPGESYYLVKLRDGMPANPVKGDCFLSGDTLYFYDGGAWVAIAGGKLDGESAYPAWSASIDYPLGEIVSYHGGLYKCIGEGNQSYPPVGTDVSAYVWEPYTVKQIFAEKDAALALKADKTSLPYAMVTPGAWTFSDGVSRTVALNEADIEGTHFWYFDAGGKPSNETWSTLEAAQNANRFTITNAMLQTISATRDSPEGQLLDHANNLIDATTGDVTLMLPPYLEGKVRDLLVYVNLGDDGSAPYTVTVNFPTGESNTGFKVKGNAAAPLPAPDAAGEWLYSFSECAPHKFAVSLAQLQDATTVGGS